MNPNAGPSGSASSAAAANRNPASGKAQPVRATSLTPATNLCMMTGGGVSGLASAIEENAAGITPRSASNSGVSALASQFEKATTVSTGPASKVSAVASKFATPASPGVRRVPSGKDAPFKEASAATQDAPPAVAGLASKFEAKSAPPARMPVRRIVSDKPPVADASAATDTSRLARVSSVAERFSGGGGPVKEETKGPSAFAAAQGAFMKKEFDAKSAEPESKVKAAASVFGDTVTAATGVAPLKQAAKKKVEEKPAVNENLIEEPGQGVSKVASVFENNAAATKREGGKEGDEPSLKERFDGAAKVFGGTA